MDIIGFEVKNGRYVKKYRHQFTTSQTAALALLLCQRGIAANRRGFCLGDLRCIDLSLVSGQLLRVQNQSQLTVAGHRFRARRHQKNGHDAGCYALGVPIPTMHAVCAGWGGPGVQALLGDALIATLKHCSNSYTQAWQPHPGQSRNYEVFRGEVLHRITPDFVSLRICKAR